MSKPHLDVMTEEDARYLEHRARTQRRAAAAAGNSFEAVTHLEIAKTYELRAREARKALTDALSS